jgi:hypothetical protein
MHFYAGPPMHFLSGVDNLPLLHLTGRIWPELDFIEKWAVSPGGLGVKDWLRAEHFVCTLDALQF